MTLIRRSLLSTALTVAMLLAGLATAFAQVTLNTTTNTAAINATQTLFPLTSVSNITVKDGLFIDREFMRVNAIDTVALTVTVTRGQQGTSARTHTTGAPVYTGPYGRFYLKEVVGSCTASAEEFLPHIVLPSGNVYQCSSGEWVVYRLAGFRERDNGRNDGGGTYLTAGALTVQSGTQFIGSGGALAMTLVVPTQEQNGMTVTFIALTAQAHTVTTPANKINGNKLTATFAAAIGNYVTFVASNGIWYMVGQAGITLT